MTSRLKTLVLAAIIGVLAAAGASAADAVAVQATVPFDFVVADRAVPAGEYRFVKGQVPGIVLIYSPNLKDAIIVPCVNEPADNPNQSHIYFTRYGSARFLQSIRVGSVHFGATVAKSRAEKEWERPRPASSVTVAAR